MEDQSYEGKPWDSWKEIFVIVLKAPSSYRKQPVHDEICIQIQNCLNSSFVSFIPFQVNLFLHCYDIKNTKILKSTNLYTVHEIHQFCTN